MKLSIFAALMAVAYSSLMILGVHFLRRRRSFLRRFGVWSVLALYAVSIFRMAFPFEFPFTKGVAWRDGLNDFYQAVYFDELPLGNQETNLLCLAGTVWLLVACVLVCAYWLRYFRVQREANRYRGNRCPQAEKVLSKIQQEWKRDLEVNVFLCPAAEIPMGLGLLNRRILLPEKTYTEKELFYILRHEFAHFCNRDILVHILVRMFCCVFWWNPLAYLLKRDVLQLLEIKCDMRATQNMEQEEIAEYLTVIVELLKSMDEKKPFGNEASVQLARKRNDFSLLERFQMVTQPTKKSGKRVKSAFLFMAVALCFASYLVVLEPSYEPPVSETSRGGLFFERDLKNASLIQEDGVWNLVYRDGVVTPLSEESAAVFLRDGYGDSPRDSAPQELSLKTRWNYRGFCYQYRHWDGANCRWTEKKWMDFQ